jgi:predicted DsbA family dithiol-disulfide isomerase
MSSLLYENKPKKIDDMLKLVEELNLDKEKFLEDLDSKATLDELRAEIKASDSLGIDATPTMYVNGEKIVGAKPYEELKGILVKHGAKRK